MDTPELTMETIEEGLALAGTALGFPHALQEFDTVNQVKISKIMLSKVTFFYTI